MSVWKSGRFVRWVFHGGSELLIGVSLSCYKCITLVQICQVFFVTLTVIF